jgi:hypothetical protein
MKFEMFPMRPAEPLEAKDLGDRHYSICGKSPGRHFDEQYVEFGGFFGSYGPHVFTAAPELLAALKLALPYIDCNKRGGIKAIRAAQAALAKSEATS